MTKALDTISVFLKKMSIKKKILASFFIVFFILSLVPIIVTCFYSVPGADDHGFALLAHQAYISGGSFWQGAIDSFNFYYNNWQGFYTANFFFSIQPFAIEIHLYWITNLLYLIVFLLSFFYCSKVILMDVLKSSITDFILILIPIVTVFIQFMPGVQQAFYNTVDGFSLIVNSIYLVVFSCIIKYHLYSLWNRNGRKKYFIVSILLTIVFSGVTPIIFVTALMLFVPFSIYCIYKKYEVWKLLVAVMLILTIGLIISMAAPGNAVRQAAAHGLPFLKAIIKALVMSVYYFGEYATLFYIATLAFLAGIFYGIAANTKFTFRHPFLVFVFCYLIFASRISIQYYATGSVGNWRQLNEHYFAFIICISISFLYFIGWISKRNSKRLDTCGCNTQKIKIIPLLVIALLFCSGTVYYGYSHVVTSFSTAKSLIKGDTQQYNKEMLERIEIYKHSYNDEVYVHKLSVYPDIWKEDVISFDKEFFSNEEFADYYENKSITLIN